MQAGSERSPAATRGTFVLSFDVEDWHQLVHRRLGLDGWDVSHPALERQVRTILDLLDELGVRATFFVLGVSAKNHPALVREIAGRGHEVACHGYGHARVYTQTPEEFRRDVQAGAEVIESLAGRRPSGYRAPAFSINRDTPWAYEILADLGFRYDSSQYDSPRVPRRIQPIPAAAYRLGLDSGRELWEFPIAVWRVGSRSLPVGGGGYWRMLPGPLLRHALDETAKASPCPVLYFHPYECDPKPLRAELPAGVSSAQRARAAARSAYRNAGRRRTLGQLRLAARRFRLVPYEELLAEGGLAVAGAGALPRAGEGL